MPIEVELKFSLDPKAAASVARLPLLLGHAAEKPTTRILKSTYFDTPDADLRRSGVTLRLRRTGRDWWQTLKEDDSGSGGLYARAESEHRVTPGRLDLGKIGDARLRKKLAKWQAKGELGPRFETVIRRTTWLLNTADGAVIECAMDRGQVRTFGGRRSWPLCEIELELKAGTPSALFPLARDMAGALPLAVEPRSKAERGYALWLRKPLSQPRKATPLLLPDNATLADAMAEIVGSGLAHLQCNWQAARVAPRYDPEHVHQMRVASRRLRTAFTVFGHIDTALKAHPLAVELRWLAGLLGEARDWDVLLAETFPKLLATFPDERALRALARKAGAQRQRARLAAREALHSPRYFGLLLDLTEFVVALRARTALAVPVTPVAAALLTRRDKQLRRRAKHLAELSAIDRHALRIAAKKLRYTAEFFGSLFSGRKLEKFLHRFSELQKALGMLNDLATTRALMLRLAPGASAETQRALGLCIGWAAGLEEGSLTDLARCWESVERTAQFWPNDDSSDDTASAATSLPAPPKPADP